MFTAIVLADMVHKGELSLRDMILAKGALFTRAGEFRFRENLDLGQVRSLIESDQLDAAIYLDQDFDRLIAVSLPGRVSFYYKETDEGGEERKRLGRTLEQYRDRVTKVRVQALGIDSRVVLHPVEINRFNLVSDKEKVAFVVGRSYPICSRCS